MRVAVTGGAGYIGSHAVVGLLNAGHTVLIIDNFANAERDVPDRIRDIAERAAQIAEIDITDVSALGAALDSFRPDAVIHFAGLKAVGEAVQSPLGYYHVNVLGSLSLLRQMNEMGVHCLVFSSSATVYGDAKEIPIPEDHPLGPTNPYGHSKRMVEQMIEDWAASNPAVSAVSLRYFNPVGAHPSARIGEAPSGVPSNLMPYLAQVATRQRERLYIFGDDYDTPDGTGVRDYIHVADLAEAHLAALDWAWKEKGARAFNVGTGRGYSVSEMIRAFERVSGRNIPYGIVDRRPGDVANSVADTNLAKKLLGWRAKRGLDQMCRDAWRWELTCSPWSPRL